MQVYYLLQDVAAAQAARQSISLFIFLDAKWTCSLWYDFWYTLLKFANVHDCSYAANPCQKHVITKQLFSQTSDARNLAYRRLHRYRRIKAQTQLNRYTYLAFGNKKIIQTNRYICPYVNGNLYQTDIPVPIPMLMSKSRWWPTSKPSFLNWICCYHRRI